MTNTSTASTNSGCRRQGFQVVMVLTLMFALGSIGPIGPQVVMAQDLDNSDWQQLPDMAQRRWEPGTVVLDDLLYVFGGYTNRPEPGPKSIKHVDVFDPKDNSWRQLADLPMPERYAVEVRWIPFVLRLKGKGERSIYSERKAKYSYMDARRWANRATSGRVR